MRRVFLGHFGAGMPVEQRFRRIEAALEEIERASHVVDNRTFTFLTGSKTYDPGSLADGAGATTTVTVTGAKLGDFAVASFSLALSDITVTSWVSASNTVSVRFQNESTGTVDLDEGTLKAAVLQEVEGL